MGWIITYSFVIFIGLTLLSSMGFLVLPIMHMAGASIVSSVLIASIGS